MWWTYPAMEECKRLYYEEKKSVEEIAKYFNAPENSVRNILGLGISK